MTENQLEKLGFDFIKSYSHGDYWTRRFKKGVLEVEFTYHSKTDKLETLDVTIDEVNCLPIDFKEIKSLDKVLNKTLIKTIEAKDLKENQTFSFTDRKNAKKYTAYKIVIAEGKAWEHAIKNRTVDEGQILVIGKCGTSSQGQFLLDPDTKLFINQKN